MQQMFSQCSSLTSLDVSNFDTSKVRTMEGMFASCSSITNLDLSNFNTSGVTDMESMFAYCKNLTHLDLSSFDTTKVSNTRQMFRAAIMTDLLVQTNDPKLLAYNYAADNRIPSDPIFNPDGGRFPDGNTTPKSYFAKVAMTPTEVNDKMKLSSLESFLTDNEPTKQDYNIINWTDPSGKQSSEITNILD